MRGGPERKPGKLVKRGATVYLRGGTKGISEEDEPLNVEFGSNPV
jgi:hypothetical protein